MAVYHDEVEIEDFEYDEDEEMYYYPCPCGDKFEISLVSKLSQLPVGNFTSVVVRLIYQTNCSTSITYALVRRHQVLLLTYLLVYLT